MTADVVIRGGTVVDGTGAPGRPADIAITGGIISDIGPGLSGRRELEASGQIVTPGFVDIHTHYDAQVFWDPALSPSCWHGVTSVVAGNCGFSIAPVRPDDRALLVRTLQHVEDMSPETLFAGVPWDEFETFPQYLDAIEARDRPSAHLDGAAHREGLRLARADHEGEHRGPRGRHRSMAAGVVPAADVPDEPARAVHVQHAGCVPGAHGPARRRPARGVPRPGLASARP